MTKLVFISAFIMDLIFGDPPQVPHMVVLMGKVISKFEKFIRRFAKSSKGELLGGALLAVFLPAVSVLTVFLINRLLRFIHPVLAVVFTVFVCFQSLAVRDLYKESIAVFKALKDDDIVSARKLLSRIVGRDTENLTKEQIIKADIETIAENFSDGIAAPMFYMAIGGVYGAVIYKSINTLDSMVGYKNDKYLYFGRCSAKLDDILNFIPSRISAFLLMAAAFLLRYDYKSAYKIWKRDRFNHKSPNSAQTEATAAGALNIMLGGSSSYFGKIVEKPTIGDDIKQPELSDIVKTEKLMILSSFILFFILLILV